MRKWSGWTKYNNINGPLDHLPYSREVWQGGSLVNLDIRDSPTTIQIGTYN